MKFTLLSTLVLALTASPAEGFFQGLFEFLFGPSETVSPSCACHDHSRKDFVTHHPRGVLVFRLLTQRGISSWTNEQKYTFVAVLSAAQENPACAITSALGNAIATYDSETNEFCYKLSYIGLSQPEEAASHIHAPAAIGANGPVLFTLLQPGANKAGCVTVMTDEAEDSLLEELWYFNVHTEACGSGELRGQILLA
jgi:hypothetical protein